MTSLPTAAGSTAPTPRIDDHPPTTTDASAVAVPTSPTSAKPKNKNKLTPKRKEAPTAVDEPIGDSPAAATSPSMGSKNKNKKPVADEQPKQSEDALASGSQERAVQSKKDSKRAKKQGTVAVGEASTNGDGTDASGPPMVSAANVVDVVEGAEHPTGNEKGKRKRDGPKKKGGKKVSGDVVGGEVDRNDGGNETTSALAHDGSAATPKRTRTRSYSKSSNPAPRHATAAEDVPNVTGAASNNEQAEPTSSSAPGTAADVLAAANAKAPKKPKRSRSKSGRKQERTALALGGDTAAEPRWATNTKSDAENDSQWQQQAMEPGAAAPTRQRDPSSSSAKKQKTVRKDSHRKSGGLSAGATAGGDQEQPEWMTSAKSDAEDDSIWAHKAERAEGNSVATKTVPGSAKSVPKLQQQQREEGGPTCDSGAHRDGGHSRQRRPSGPMAHADGDRQQPHPSKSRDNWRRRPSTEGDQHQQQQQQQRRDPHQPAPRRPASGKQEGQALGDGNEGGGHKKGRNKGDHPRGAQQQPQPRNQLGGRARTASRSERSAAGRSDGQSKDAAVDEVSESLQNVSLVDPKSDTQPDGKPRKLEHSPPHSPTKFNHLVDIRKALGPDFGDHVKEITEALSKLEIEYADPSTWSDLYPEDVQFRPFYFQDQSIPIPGDSAVLFPPPWSHTSWDDACPPPAHPVSMFHRLSLELFAFSEHVKLSPVDEFLRSCAYARLEAMVSRLLPDGCEMFVFGSSASPLANPNSDLDVGIFPKNPNNLTLESGRRQARLILDKLFRYILVIAVPRSVEAVFHAKVPLIKYTDRATGIEVDVSVQWEGGESVDIVYALAAKYPGLVPIVRTIKSLLSLHSLNSGRDGGIHGFCVMSMVAGFLGRLDAMGLGVSVKVTEREGKVYPAPHMHGLAFLAFLHFVGFVWDPATTGMDNTNDGALFYRHNKCDSDYRNHILLVTSVRPQLTPENVGRSVRAETWVAFRSVCQHAFMRLYQTAGLQMAPPAPGSAYGSPESGSSSLLRMFLTVPPLYRKAMAMAEAAVDQFSQFNKFDGSDFNAWVEHVVSRERAYFRRKFEDVSEQMNRRGERNGGNRGGQQQGGRGGSCGGGQGGARNQPQNRPQTDDVSRAATGGQPNETRAQNTSQGPPARGQPNPRSRKNTREDIPVDHVASASTMDASNACEDGDDAQGQGSPTDDGKKKKKKKAKKPKKDRDGVARNLTERNEEHDGVPEEGAIFEKVEQALEKLELVDADAVEN